jgi:hypothetical protein
MNAKVMRIPAIKSAKTHRAVTSVLVEKATLVSQINVKVNNAQLQF